MADPILNPESTSVIALPDVAPSESAPSNGVGAAPAPTETLAAPAPAPAVNPAEEVALEPSLMETFEAEEAKKKAEAELTGEKPAEKPAVEAKPAEAEKPAEPAALAPVEYAYTVPETLKIDDAAKETLHKALDGFRADPSKGAQALIDLHNDRMKEFAAESLRNQIRTFNDTRRSWRDQIKADPILGGSGFETAQRAIGRMRTLLVADKDKGAFDEFLKTTGAGDHPQFHKLLHNAARLYDEPPAPSATPSPTPNNGAPAKRTLRDLYKSNT